jgi:hypothetical protein
MRRLPPKRLRRLPPGGAASGRAEPDPRLQLGFGNTFLASAADNFPEAPSAPPWEGADN